jgi:ABC-type lipoprotein export system ATPase subunit
MQLELDDVGHHYPSSPWLFRHLTATLLPNQTYALVGPSGSGKSTLMSLVARWESPIEGDIRASGISKVNWVFQSPYGMPRRTAIDHVALPFLSRSADRNQADDLAFELLTQFDLAHVARQEFRSLSGGEAQRLMLARAVAAKPQLLLIDEPTAQLDSMTAGKVNNAIASLASPERLILIATHDERTRDSCTECLDLLNFVARGDTQRVTK